MSLIQVYDALTSGRMVRSIAFTDGVMNCPCAEGMKVRLFNENVNADGWVCFSAQGIWLTYNANVATRDGYDGHQGREEPLSSIVNVTFV